MIKDEKVDKCLWPRRDNIVSFRLWLIRLDQPDRMYYSALKSRNLSERRLPATASSFIVGVGTYIHLRPESHHDLRHPVSGHGTQISCIHHTESDGYDECMGLSFDFPHVASHVYTQVF